MCQGRDIKGMYAQAASGELADLTGVGQVYEPPEHPDLRVCGDGDLDDAVAAVVAIAGRSRPEREGGP